MNFVRKSVLILAAGSALFKPFPMWSLIVGVVGSVEALGRALAVDLAPIRVNIVCPGAVDTEVNQTLQYQFCRY